MYGSGLLGCSQISNRVGGHAKTIASTGQDSMPCLLGFRYGHGKAHRNLCGRHT